nr:MAG TPA: hypothetical protein [Caudoviricetes sp.]
MDYISIDRKASKKKIIRFFKNSPGVIFNLNFVVFTYLIIERKVKYYG